ncbi:MAG: DNA mismatch repair protein MutS [Chloroflexota bacterium]|nr:DNA mismatch repair protein MutS [Chloroflexota bacterium]
MSTPIRQQYLQIKRQYLDTILFFRMGDFYETFDDDARLVSSKLDIVLTAREVRGRKVPMAGVPHHSVDGYLARLVASGHKVAVCEQIGEPNGKDIVERRVVRVLTPGTVDEPSMLDSKRNNYIAALVLASNGAGLAYADITTGELAATQIGGAEYATRAREELQRLAPVEVVVSEGASSAEPGPEWRLLHTPGPLETHVSTSDGWRWKLDRATEAVLGHTGATTLEAFGLERSPLATRAVGGLLQYVEATSPNSLAILGHIRTYTLSEHMLLDERTRSNLELTESTRGDRAGSLLGVLDHTCTPMGGRALRRWLNQPLLDREVLESRLDSVSAFVRDAAARSALREALSRVSDLERLVNRAVQGSIAPRELRAVGESLSNLPRLRKLLEELGAYPATSAIQPMPDLVDLLLTALVDNPPAARGAGPIVREGYSTELDRLRGASGEARRWIAGLERTERERTGIKALKVGYNKVFGYYIEVSNAAKEAVPAEYTRKQTLVGAERYITSELKEYEALILNSQTQAEELEQTLYRQIVAQVTASARLLGACAAALAELDCLLSLAEASARNRYVRPELTCGEEIEIRGGRHPVVEQRASDGFVANDACLDTKTQQVLLLTGPNMAGKSTFLRQVALITLMAQVGCYVPAQSARLGLVDRIFTRVGAQDDIASGQSTFMVEMTETAYILGHCTSRSLVVLDEIGRGTSTYDGLAIAQAVVEYLHNSPRAAAKTLFATHYHELNALADILPRVANYRMDVLEEGDEVVFLRKVVPGGADRSYGIHVARLAGMPRAVVRRSQELLKELEGVRRRAQAAPDPQLTFLNPDDGLLHEIAGLDVESMTPVEALTQLYKLQSKAAEKVRTDG